MLWFRWLELFIVFILSPLLFFLMVSDIDTWLMPMLFSVGGICLYLLLRDNQFKRFRLWNTDNFRAHLLQSLKLFIPCAGLTTLIIYLIAPDLLFNLPTQHLELWLLTLIIYPIVSVLPQEVIFRTYFFHRYKRIIPSKTHRWLLSSLSFGLAHIVYGNWIAVALSAAAGAVFGYRYMQTRSTLLVVVEHTLWGSFMFTIGLGAFFLTTAV